MALPKLQTSEYTLTLPSTQEELNSGHSWSKSKRF